MHFRHGQDARGRLKKIDGAVPFPFKLDIADYCDRAADGGPAAPAAYQLVGIVEHSGNMRYAVDAQEEGLRVTAWVPNGWAHR